MTKKKPKSEHKPNGRPTKMIPENIAKLEQAFAFSFTDEEACLFADISMPTLYRYIQEHPEFGEKKEMLKKTPNLKAKTNIIKKIQQEDTKASAWWLERKSKDEFSTKVEQDVKQIDNPLEDFRGKEKK